MIGVELERECGALVGRALERGLVINVTSDNVIRLLPPLVIGFDLLDEGLDVLVEAIRGAS